MEPTPKVHEIADPVAREAQAASRFFDLAELSSFECPTFPCDTAAAAGLLRACGYRVDPDWMLAALKDGIAFDVKTVGGKRVWSAWACWHALAILESRRRWTLHPMHMHKLSGPELAALQNEADGNRAFHDLDKFSVEQLVLALTDADNRDVRRALSVGLLAKLREGGML